MKLKRLFTAVLSTALALSLCAMPAMAVEGGAATGTTPTTSTSTIDIRQKGSITIYKRALDKGESEGEHGDGETMKNPQGTALKDTGFTLYQVMDAKALVAYYENGSKDEQVDVKKYFKSYDTDKTAAGLKETYNKPYKTGEILTDKKGMAQFTGLEVGMYLVIETKTPQAVTVPAEPFLVSIPMTRIGDTAEGEANQNQKQWLYDVTVYPKNSIAKGTVKLVKQGKQGDAEPTSLTDVKFDLYRKSDAVGGGYDKVNVTDLVTNDKGEVTLQDLTKGRYYLLETGYDANKDTGYILNTGKFYFDINEDGKPVLVTDSTITDKVADDSFAIDTEHSTLTVTNYKPDIEKTVTKRDNTKDSHEADYGIGDAVPFTLTIDVPKNVESLKTFKVTDTTNVNQLKHNENPVTVKGIKADAGKTKVDFVKGTDYTLNIDTNGTMTIDFGATKSEKFKSVAGGKIIIDYTATVQKNAVVAGDGNVNTAKIVYSRETNLTEETDNNPYEITDKGVVYTFDLNIHKTGKGGDKDGPLEGVTFDLYKKVVTEKPNEDGTYPFRDNKSCPATSGVDAKKLGLTDKDNETWIKVDTLNTDDKGNASAKGLPSGTYKLVETKTVNGYNLLSKPVDAKLNLAYSEAWQTTTTYENGNLTKSTITKPTYTRGDNEPATPGEVIEIVNRAGFTLPVTGGFGTLLFSGIGVLLVLAGVGVLFSLKKKPNRA